MPVPAANPLSLPPIHPKQTSYVVLKDFYGGIQGMVDKTAIPLEATPMCRNVVFRKDGGFMCRPSVRPLGIGDTSTPVQGLTSTPVWFGDFWRRIPGAGESSWYLVVTAANKLLSAPNRAGATLGNGQWTDLGVTRIGPVTTEVYDNLLYVSLGNLESNSTTQRIVRSDGTVVTPLGTAWSEDIAAPTVGNMPPGRYVAWMNERMWVGNMATADGLGLRNRVHFSHLGHPEAWRSEDYITIGGPDEITGICALRDMLVVFKRDSTWGIQGYGEDTFRVLQISGEVGCTGQFHRNTDFGVVWWDKTLGVCQFNGRGVENLFKPLLPFLSVDQAISACKGLIIANGDIFALTDYSGYEADNTGGLTTTWANLSSSTPWATLFQQQARWRDSISTFGDVVWHLQSAAGSGWTTHTIQPPGQAGATMLGLSHATTGRDRLVLGFEPVGTGAFTYLATVVGGQSNGLDSYDPYWWDFSGSWAAFDKVTARWPGALHRDTDNAVGTGPGTIHEYDGGVWVVLGNESDLALVGRLRVQKMPVIDAWYLTPWMHAGLPGQIKRFRAPRVVQEGDQAGDLLIDVFYDYGEDNLRRVLHVPVATATGKFSYSVNKPGTVGRARSIQFKVRNDPTKPRHWGVSQIALPYHPKRMR